MRLFRKCRVPANAHPIVRFLFTEMNNQRVGLLDLSERAGVSKNTICNWRNRATPALVNMDACLNVLGFQITVAETPEEKKLRLAVRTGQKGKSE